jgi:hypothetical protein
MDGMGINCDKLPHHYTPSQPGRLHLEIKHVEMLQVFKEVQFKRKQIKWHEVLTGCSYKIVRKRNLVFSKERRS